MRFATVFKTSMVLPLIALLALAGCGGRESLTRTGGGPATRTTLPEPRTGSSSSAWSNSSEYRNSNGLALMRAGQGYAARTTGQPGGLGKTVAVLDTPLDVNHDDLLARGATTERFDFEFDNPNFRNSGLEHGTHVAGTVAARRNGYGVHGVAYNANLKGISVLRAVPPTRLHPFPVVETSSDVATGIASAAGLRRPYTVYDQLGRPVPTGNPFQPYQQKVSQPAAEADVIQMSLGTPDHQGQVLSAMREAAGENKIMVAALGNCGQGGRNHAQCNFFRDFDGVGPASAPAQYVTWSGVAGYGIAVGALDESGSRRALFSNACGEVAQYCLFAPGSNIRSTVPQGGFDQLSGTSMAAPHVSGAAAVLWAAFPNKNARQIVSRLLDTAQPLDRYGISSTFGHGKLDLRAAMRPAGFLSLSMPSGAMTPVSGSAIQLPPGFDMSPSLAQGLTDAVVYDEQLFPFRYDLGNLVQQSDTNADDSFAHWFLSSLGGEAALVRLGNNASAWVSDGEPDTLAAAGDGNSADDGEVERFHVHFQPAAGVRMGFGTVSNGSGLSTGHIAGRTHGAVLGEEFSAAPFASLAGEGLALSVDWRFDEKTTVDLAGKDGKGYFDAADAQLGSVGITREIGDNWTVGMRYGVLREDGSVAGIHTSGAFGGRTGAETQFGNLAVEGKVSEGTSLFGSMSRGVTEASRPTNGSLLSGLSGVRTDAFLIGAEVTRLWEKSDRLTVTASSPFRAQGVHLTLAVPDREVADGEVEYRSQDVDLEPRGREGRLQAVYETGIGGGASAAFGTYLRINPGHDPSADPEFGLAAKMYVAF